MAEDAKRRRRRLRVRPWLRALHRDVGYLAVGLTFVYAISGLAVNHIADWDPNFTQIDARHEVPTPIPHGDRKAARYVLDRLDVDGTPIDIYRAGDERLDIIFEQRTFHVNPTSGTVFEEGQKPRPFLRVANYLHLNRGKKAWTYVADAYAVFLLFLASSGLFMLGGRKGLLGRGAFFVALGAVAPIAYVTLSGAP